MEHKKFENKKNDTRKLDQISLLVIEADLLCEINFDDIIKNFASHKSRTNTLR